MSAPDALDLSAAARLVVEADEYPDDRWYAATVALWEALTGIEDSTESVAYARLVAAAVPPVTAAIPPF